MLTNSKAFYNSYQKDFHKVKAEYLISMLDNLPKYEEQVFHEKLNEEMHENFRRILKMDLRQTYFHAIETVFELIFALKPVNNSFNDLSIQLSLTYANWRNTSKLIEKIAKENYALDFLDDRINFSNKNINIGQYIFYMHVFSHNNYKEELGEKVKNSLEAIKYGLKIIANDFIDREEYNAYKHGLRIIPSSKKIMLADAETLEPKIEWDLSDSMSFHVRMEDNENIKTVTKLFDSERDYKMIQFCSALIHQIIFYRRLAMNSSSDNGKFSTFNCNLFSIEGILEYSKHNTDIQNIIFTQTKI